MPKSRLGEPEKEGERERGRGGERQKGSEDCEQPHRAHSINLQPVNSHLRQCRAVEEWRKVLRFERRLSFSFHNGNNHEPRLHDEAECVKKRSLHVVVEEVPPKGAATDSSKPLIAAAHTTHNSELETELETQTDSAVVLCT